MIVDRSVAISSYQGRKANEDMETLLLIAFLMVAVDGPATPTELSQEIQNGISAEDSSPRSSAWTGGPEVNMWTGSGFEASDDLSHHRLWIGESWGEDQLVEDG